MLYEPKALQQQGSSVLPRLSINSRVVPSIACPQITFLEGKYETGHLSIRCVNLSG